MCEYGGWASGAMGRDCSPTVVGSCTICGMEFCEACYIIGMENYNGKCPCGKGNFILD